MHKIRKAISKFLKIHPLVKVYSHPRSGTHFLEAFLAKNFYQNKDLAIEEITWGHWSNRLVKEEGNPYGQLFGNHYFGYENKNDSPKIYIYRDGRAVAYSIWKTPNFIHKKDANLSFNEFLKYKLDWSGSPSIETTQEYTILEHWLAHVDSWKELAKDDNNLLILRYEDLIDNPYGVYKKIRNKFFSESKILSTQKVDFIKSPTGLLPNRGTKDAWKDFLNEENNLFFLSLIKSSNHIYGYH